eukprot:COSAG01_NODE_70464_length_258_cov_0.981132_1_plen_79_part_10
MHAGLAEPQHLCAQRPTAVGGAGRWILVSVGRGVRVPVGGEQTQVRMLAGGALDLVALLTAAAARMSKDSGKTESWCST